VTSRHTARIGIPMSPKRAIIDIGSNTVRLVLYGGPPRAPVVLHNEKITAKLGRCVGETGLLSDKAMASALAALARYHALVVASGVSDVDVVATAAVRDATNGAQFLEAITALGLKPRLLSGEEEAVTSANGVIAAFPDARGECCEHGISLPLGTLLLPRLREVGPAGFSRQVTSMLQSADLSGGKGLPLYLVGGSNRAFARYAINDIGWPLDDPHGFELDIPTANDLALSLARIQSKSALEVPGLSGSRLSSLPDVGALLAVLIEVIQPSSLVFSSWGLREGLIYRSLSPEARTQNPLLAGIGAFAESHGCPTRLAAMVAGWTAGAVPRGGNQSEPLRLGATMMALASLGLEPNLRASHAVDWALRKRWIGVDCVGRAMLAAAALANAGRSSLSLDLDRLAPAERLAEATIWGQAIRLCRRFTAGSPLSLSSSGLSAADGQLTLSAHESMAALFTESIEKELRLLAKMLDLKPAFDVVSDGAVSQPKTAGVKP